MSIKASLSRDGVEVYTLPTLKEMCLYKCWTNKEILTKEVEADEEALNGNERLPWEKFRLKEPIPGELVEALLDAGDEYLFSLTPKYEPVLAAIRMSQPKHLVKVHVSNTDTLKDCQLEFLLSGGNVKSLDINGCDSLGSESLDAINTFGNRLEYLRIGECLQILPTPPEIFSQSLAILRTPNLKTFIVSYAHCNNEATTTHYWRLLLQDFIRNLEELRIIMCGQFGTLEFLEPAKDKLTSLTLSNCEVRKNANAWASLFKLDNLRSLDLVGSSIGRAFVGENVVQRLLTTMPNLTHLAVDSGLVKDLDLDSSIRGQGSMAKRLKFLGIMNKDVTELKNAKLLAKDVAHFGTFEGELRILEYISDRLNPGTLQKRLLEHFIEVSETLPCKMVAAINLFFKPVKYYGISFVNFELMYAILKKLLTTDVAANLGDVFLDQCIGATFCLMRKQCRMDVERNPHLPNHYQFMYPLFVPTLMCMTEIAMTMATMRNSVLPLPNPLKDLLKNIAQLLEEAMCRDDSTHDLLGISSLLVVIKQLKDAMVHAKERDRIDLVEISSNLITSLRKLCLQSRHRRAAFHSKGGVRIVMDFLAKIVDGCLGLADHDSFALLEILRIILQDTELELDLSESGMIASYLEKLLLSIHSQWEPLKSSNSDEEATQYFKMESIVCSLKSLESDPRLDYKASAAIKEIAMKLK